ncbi:MAG: enoyl-CoA hydratase/isomerase family protein [Paracoccaceae bacterium]
MSDASNTVLSHVENGVGTLTFNRPERLNAISIPMLEVLIEKLGVLVDDDAVRAIVLTGAGTAPARRRSAPGPIRARWSPATLRNGSFW